MSTISTHSAVIASSRARAEAPANSGAAAPRAEIAASQPSNGNSSSSSLQVSNDQVAVTSRASALATNDSINRVLSDIVGPKNESGTSGAASLQTNFTSSSSDDPAAKFRSDTPVNLEGYDATKLANPDHKTPKYLFGRVAQGFKLDSLGGDKAKAEELLTAMVPDFKKAGLEVVSVKGDRIQVKTELGYEWVDVIRASGAAKGEQGWQWGSEGKGTPNPTKDFKEFCDLTGIGGAAAAAGGASSGGAAAGGGAAGAAAPAGPPKATPLGNQIDQSKVLPILQKYKVLDIENAVKDPEIQKAYPGARVIPHPQRLDKIEFPNGAVVDCVVAAGDPSAKWGWMPEN
jgi:hypothetical protein